MTDVDDSSDDERAISVDHDDDDSSFNDSPLQADDDEYEEEKRPVRRSVPSARKTIPVNDAAFGGVKATATVRTTPPKKAPSSTTSNKPKNEDLPPPSSTKKRKRNIKRNIYDADGYDIVVPNSLLDASQPNSEFSLLLQMDEDDHRLSGGVDWTSAIGGIIGRMELGTSPDQAIVLDLQGQQYHGYLFPGPTACVLSMIGHEEENDTTEGTSVLRLDHITDEFCNLIRRPKSDALASTTDNYFHYPGDVDVNREAHSNVPTNDDSQEDLNLQARVLKTPRSQVVARGNKKKKRSASKK